MKNLVKIFGFLLFLGVFGLTKATAQENIVQYGKASYYAKRLQGHRTASGERYNHKSYTAAHRNLPFGTKIKVTNLKNNKSVIVKINDRGHLTRNRVIDISGSAAKEIGLVADGVADVKVEVLDPVQAAELKDQDMATVDKDSTKDIQTF